MEYVFLDDRVVIKNVSDFSLSHTFDCGQSFRFNMIEKDHFEGVAFGRAVELYKEDKDIVITNLKKSEFLEKWVDFLDLERDYTKIKNELSQDEIIKKAIDFGRGIRILKQDFFECLISFIISQQNSIPKIKKTVEMFCTLFGKEEELNGKKYYTFPTPDMLLNLTVSDLAPLKIGYRDKYIIDAIKKVNSKEIDEDKLFNMPYTEAKKILKTISGVGDKVADCVLLFSLNKFEAFPVDTWIKKAMEGLYNVKEKEIPNYSRLNFGSYSGFAQQYIFYYIRNNK